MPLAYMPTLVSLPAPSPGPGQGICSKQKQDIGNGKEDVSWCSRALQRTCHCKGVTGPGLQLGPHTSVPGVLHCRQKRDPVTMSPRAPVLPPGLLVLAARAMFGLEAFAKGLLCHAICKVLIPPRLNGTLFPSLGSSQSSEEERQVPQSFKSEGRRREGKPPLLALALCWAPHSHSEPH